MVSRQFAEIIKEVQRPFIIFKFGIKINDQSRLSLTDAPTPVTSFNCRQEPFCDGNVTCKTNPEDKTHFNCVLY